MTRERTASENEKFRIEGIKKLAKKMEKERNYMKIDELIEDLHLAESRVRHCLEKYQFDLGISNSTIGDFQKDTKYIIRLLNEIKKIN